MRARERGRPARPHPEFVAVAATTHATAGTTTTTDTTAAAGGDRPVPANGERAPEPGAVLGAKSGAAAQVAQAVAPAPSSNRLWVNVVDGFVWTSAPAPCPEVRGGLLCDEPGLGKTITVLALLLRTRGLLPGEKRRDSIVFAPGQRGRLFGDRRN